MTGKTCVDGRTSNSEDSLPESAIQLRGVRVHNLKNIDLDIPHGQRITICGRSGSGKSSLAFDTLFAEGQRRYVESFSPYVRQFLDQMARPDADQIIGIPPAVGVQGGQFRADVRATVGTVTEAFDYLRLIFSLAAQPKCADCGSIVDRTSPQSTAAWISQLPAGLRFQIAIEKKFDSSIVSENNESIEIARKQVIGDLNHSGFSRAVIAGTTYRLQDEIPATQLSISDSIWVIVDRLKTGDDKVGRTRESLETAFGESGRTVSILLECTSHGGHPMVIDGQDWMRVDFPKRFACPTCDKEFPDPEPNLFSFNHPLGACVECNGAGFTIKKQETLKNGKDICLMCSGSRLNEIARQFVISGLNLDQLCNQNIVELINWVEEQTEEKSVRSYADIFERLLNRLKFVRDTGLGYLSLSRRANSLSNGEFQRVSLASSLGNSLVNMLYVLDEPSIGLHSQDIERLEQVLTELHQRGNTLVVVEHEPNLIMAAERVIEIGPGQGSTGGHVVFDGTPEEMLIDEKSLTGRYLSGEKAWYGCNESVNRRPTNRGSIKIRNARGRNLKNIDVEIPLGCLCAISGLSGAGKSTLIQDTMIPALQQKLGDESAVSLDCDGVSGFGGISQVVLVDQTLPAKSSRSNLATYTKTFDEIRKLFAETHDAKLKNLKPGHFSFNVKGGRCEKCSGDGFLRIDMQFMPEVLVKCDQCRGQRFKNETLAVRYRGQSIADVLALTVREAFLFFRGQPKIQSQLNFLKEVGLDYLTLGQTLSTFSTGERQRLKLASFLTSTTRGRSLLVLDEPTVGLHMADVTKLLDCFSALIAVGHSIVVIEHNLQLLQHADYIVDLGPGASEHGGQVVANGTPDEIMKCPHSVTGKWLSQFCN